MCFGKNALWMGIVFVILGILFLLVDLGVWAFAGIQWWTVLFIVFGIHALLGKKE